MSLLSEEQRLQVVELIGNFLGIPVAPGALQSLVGLEKRSKVPSADPNRIAAWVLTVALAEPDPQMFKQIVGLVDSSTVLVEVRALIARIDSGEAAWTPPPAALWIPDEWPFVDRDDLRTALDVMARGEGPAAITIEGPVGSGKKTMKLYVEQLATREGTFSAVFADYRKEPVPNVLDANVLDLRDRFGLGFPDDTTHAEPDRRATTFARDLFMDASGQTSTVWFVVNVLEVAGLEEGRLKFLDELLGLVQAEPASTRLRILVLVESANRLQLENLPPAEARHALPEVAATAVKAWLIASVPDKPEMLYELSVSRVLERVAKEPPEIRLDRMKRLLKASYKTLVGAGLG